MRKVTFDAREINLDMPLVFESTSVTFYAQHFRVGPRGSIVFTTAPSPVDSVVFVVDTLDLSAAPLHPFVFITGNKDWPGATKRLVTIIARKVVYKSPPADDTTFFVSLTLDKNYASFPQGASPLKAYTITVNNENAAQQYNSYLTDTMLWPLETAEKISRQFASAPFDVKNQELLKKQISALYEALPQGSHPLARNIVAQTLQSINLGVDNLGFYPNYVPRLIYPKLAEDVIRRQAEHFKNMQAWDQELIAAQKGVPLAATVGNIDAEVHSGKILFDHQTCSIAAVHLMSPESEGGEPGVPGKGGAAGGHGDGGGGYGGKDGGHGGTSDGTNRDNESGPAGQQGDKGLPGEISCSDCAKPATVGADGTMHCAD